MWTLKFCIDRMKKVCEWERGTPWARRTQKVHKLKVKSRDHVENQNKYMVAK